MSVLILQCSLRVKHLLRLALKWPLGQIGAIVGVVLSAPVAIVLAVSGKVDAKPVIFAHEGIGQHGRRLRCLNNWSMRMDEDVVLARLLESGHQAREGLERDLKLNGAPCFTKIGCFPCRMNLDEMLRVINVCARRRAWLAQGRSCPKNSVRTTATMRPP